MPTTWNSSALTYVWRPSPLPCASLERVYDADDLYSSGPFCGRLCPSGLHLHCRLSCFESFDQGSEFLEQVARIVRARTRLRVVLDTVGHSRNRQSFDRSVVQIDVRQMCRRGFERVLIDRESMILTSDLHPRVIHTSNGMIRA